MMCHIGTQDFGRVLDVTPPAVFCAENLTQPDVFFVWSPEFGILIFKLLVSCKIWNLLVNWEKLA
jgi:hypothetical protein